MKAESKKLSSRSAAASFLPPSLWYKDAVIYQLHVKAFYDSNNDGIGDFKGLTMKLDYLERLGVTAIWLLPFYPSPLKDDGYDIADYFNVHPAYGTMKDFKEFLREAHLRGMCVITELVINHTSDQHEWFQRARRAKPGSSLRDFYVWSDTPDRYAEARIIFKDFETSNWTWDPVAKAYYWHRFYSHQPDLNFDNPAVQRAIFRVVDFWFQLGVDGMRLDAVPYLFEREGTNCENLPETFEFLRKLRRHMDQKFERKMFLAEANQWPEDAVAYFGKGDMCHMAFHFPLMPRMFMALQMEDRFPIVDILEQTPHIPETCQWAIFLRNHDELTLEMVTDEERDYMVRMFAKDPQAKINLGIRRRLFPLLNNNRRKIELLNFLLFTLPGSPIVYYGDEIGMGDNYYLGDRNGVRTPMQWTADRNAGFSHTNPQKLYLPVIIDPEYHYETVNVENQEGNPSSFLWWMRRVIHVRRQYPAFSRGSFSWVGCNNPKVLAYIRRDEEAVLLCVANLSRFSQFAELSLEDFHGWEVEEIVGRQRFPGVRKTGYPLSLSPHAYFCFELKPMQRADLSTSEKDIMDLPEDQPWTVLFTKEYAKFWHLALRRFLMACRWMPHKDTTMQHIQTQMLLQAMVNDGEIILVGVHVTFLGMGTKFFVLPLTFLRSTEAETVLLNHPQAVVTRVRSGRRSGVVVDAAVWPGFHRFLLESFAAHKSFKTGKDQIIKFHRNRYMQDVGGPQAREWPTKVLSLEQSNTTIVFDEAYVFKLYRQLEEGINPDVEICRHLTERCRFPYIAPFSGSVELTQEGASPEAAKVVGMMNKYVAHQQNGWQLVCDEARRFYEYVLTHREDFKTAPQTIRFDPESLDLNGVLQTAISAFIRETMTLLGNRTRLLHEALAQDKGNSAFTPEPFSQLDQRSAYQSLQAMLKRSFDALTQNMRRLPRPYRSLAKNILEQQQHFLTIYKTLLQRRFKMTKIRIHGDYHLGQVLFTGRDFIIIDFEGEPIRPLSERRLKKCAFRDVAGMVRSFEYAALQTLLSSYPRKHDLDQLQPWGVFWSRCLAIEFLRGYFDETLGEGSFLPQETTERRLLLYIYLIDKALYEILYELNYRPQWIGIPLSGLTTMMHDLDHVMIRRD